MNLFIINLLILVVIVFFIVKMIKDNKTKSRAGMKQKFLDIDVKVAHDTIYKEKNKYMSDLNEMVVLDVRSPKEYSRGHIKGAISLSAMDLNFIKLLKNYDKKQRYLVYGERETRSKRVVDIMKNRGFEEVYHMMGGMIEWKLMDFPVAREFERPSFNRAPQKKQ